MGKKGEKEGKGLGGQRKYDSNYQKFHVPVGQLGRFINVLEIVN